MEGISGAPASFSLVPVCCYSKDCFMKIEERTPSGREKDEAAIQLLNELREKLHSDDISTARLAAFNLSWMQEDGLAILTEALFGEFPRTAKKAAAYGLRSMQGRMKKMALDVLERGQKDRDRITRAACDKALLLMRGQASEKGGSRGKRESGRPRMGEARNRNRTRARFASRRTPFRR